MNKKVGLLSFPPDDNKLQKPYSNDTAHMIDGEVRELVESAYNRTVDLITERRDMVEKMALALLDKEVSEECEHSILKFQCCSKAHTCV